MSRRARHCSAVFIAVALGVGCAGLHAQELGDLCPGVNSGKSAAVVGLVQDVESGMILPGVQVVVSWMEGETPMRTEALVSADGTFSLCSLPREVELSLRASFAGRPGSAVALTLMEPVTRQDLGVSLSSASEDIPVYWPGDDVPCAYERLATVWGTVSAADYRAAASKELARLAQRHEADAVVVKEVRLPFLVERGDRPRDPGPATRPAEGIAIRFTEAGCAGQERKAQRRLTGPPAGRAGPRPTLGLAPAGFASGRDVSRNRFSASRVLDGRLSM